MEVDQIILKVEVKKMIVDIDIRGNSPIWLALDVSSSNHLELVLTSIKYSEYSW